MAVFPDQMNKVNPIDEKKAIAELEKYINYMVERIEHSISLLNRRVSDLEQQINGH